MATFNNKGGFAGLSNGDAGFPSFLQPTQGKNLYAGNYLDFFATGHQQWAQQFLPDVYDKEVEIYGNRTISGFLKMVSAEMPSTSDQIIWLEQGRLHTRYENVTLHPGGTTVGTIPGTLGTARTGTANFTAGELIAGAVGSQASPDSETSTTEISGPTGTTGNLPTGDSINFRVGQTVMIGQNSSTVKALITAVSGANFQARVYKATDAPGATGYSTSGWSALVYGSEFAKGTGNFTEKLDPSYSTYSNAPIIMKEHYSINGSDTGQIGWIEVTSENGASGYLWYVKAEHENRLRWEDYIEMSMVEGVASTNATNNQALFAHRGDFGSTGAVGATGIARGTQGFFDALEERGNVWTGLAADLNADALNTSLATPVESFDNILQQLDKQGAIEENMLYVNRGLSLAFDNMLSGVNSTGNATGTSYGVFSNSSDMALNLGFKGFRRGSYDFYQTDWKYLNDWSTRGGFGDIEGVMIPAGTSTVYDQNLGKNIKRPSKHTCLLYTSPSPRDS